MAFVEIASSEQLAEGEAQGFVVEEKPVFVVRYQGVVRAMDDVCSHQYALLSEGWYEDGKAECPLHQAQFDVCTGHASCGPKTGPVAVFKVCEQGGRVSVDVTQNES
jgi:3-phenylpropionate/trans-cinnamate dioxygenase ferredoxin component